MLKIFISSLESKSGKTLIASGLAATMQSLSYSTYFYKPIQIGAKSLNGFLQSQDLALIKRIDDNIQTYSTYNYQSDSSPLVAAYEAESKIDVKTIYADFQARSAMYDCNIVEGANSISAPVAEKFLEVNIPKNLNLPVVLVINPKITSVSDAISGINFIYDSGVNFLGVIVNDYDFESSNLEEKYFPQLVKEYTGVKILGTIPHYSNIDALTPETLIGDILNNLNVEEIFGLKIAKLNT